MLHRVHAQNRREQGRHWRQRSDMVRDAGRDAVALQAARQRRRQRASKPGDHEREENAD